jgi:lysophospholipase L1-like esterase
VTERRGGVGRGLAATAVLTLAVLGVEVWVTVGREYLSGDPGFVVDETVRPAAGARGGAGAVELVMLGDSQVAGVGSPTVAESLAVLVAQRVADRTGRPVHVVGYGVSGARTSDVATDQVPALVDARADVVVIMVGANDVTHATPSWVLRERTEALLRTAAEQGRAPVVLAGIPRFRAVPALPQPLRALTDAYAVPLRAAQRRAVEAVEGARFVEIARDASPRFLGRPSAMSEDGFHPSPEGYGYFADAIAPVVVAALDEADP